MRYYRIILIALLVLSSCSSPSNNPQETSTSPEASQETESTREIIDKYVDTLTTAKDKAKKAAGAVERRAEEENQSIQEMEKE